MNFFLETLMVLLMSIWYTLEALVYTFIPRRKKNISGEVVLITGAGSGIGRLMAQEFASHATVLVLWDINQDGMKETAKLVKECGARKVHYYLCDCSDRNEVYRVAEQVRLLQHGTVRTSCKWSCHSLWSCFKSQSGLGLSHGPMYMMDTFQCGQVLCLSVGLS